jgi:Tol biopolymer transport system component
MVFRTFAPATGATADLIVFPAGHYAGMPAVSPDGRRVAFSLFRPGTVTAPDSGGADLYVMVSDGTRERLMVAHDAPGAALTNPVWAPDGRALYFTRIGRDGHARIERVSQDGSNPQTVMNDGEAPTLSPGGYMAFVRTALSANTQALMIARADGRGLRTLVDPAKFLTLMVPRFSPDGSRVVFAAAGGSRPRPTHGWSPPGSGFSVRFGLEDAWAHGLPMDLWIIRADGSNLRPLTDLGEDDPVSVWSPDGRWIAFTGALGLYLIDVARGTVLRIHDEGGGGGLAWLDR